MSTTLTDHSSHHCVTLLGVQITRLNLKGMAADGGKFVAPNFVERFITFMTTPGSHNDTCVRGLATY